MIVLCTLVIGLLSVAECRTAVLADWHDRDDANIVPGADGRSLVQLLFRVHSGLFSLDRAIFFICI